MPRRFEPDSGSRNSRNPFKRSESSLHFLIRLAWLARAPTTMAPPTDLPAARPAQGTLREVQSSGTKSKEPAGRALAHPLSTRLEKGERLSSADAKTNAGRRCLGIHTTREEL